MDPWRSTTLRSTKGVRTSTTFFFKLSQNVYLFHYIHRDYCFSFLKFEGYITFLWWKKNTLRLRVKCMDTTNTFSYCFSIINFEGHITFFMKEKILWGWGLETLKQVMTTQSSNKIQSELSLLLHELQRNRWEVSFLWNNKTNQKIFKEPGLIQHR